MVYTDFSNELSCARCIRSSNIFVYNWKVKEAVKKEEDFTRDPNAVVPTDTPPANNSPATTTSSSSSSTSSSTTTDSSTKTDTKTTTPAAPEKPEPQYYHDLGADDKY